MSGIVTGEEGVSEIGYELFDVLLPPTVLAVRASNLVPSASRWRTMAVCSSSGGVGMKKLTASVMLICSCAAPYCTESICLRTTGLFMTRASQCELNEFARRIIISEPQLR